MSADPSPEQIDGPALAAGYRQAVHIYKFVQQFRKKPSTTNEELRKMFFPKAPITNSTIHVAQLVNVMYDTGLITREVGERTLTKLGRELKNPAKDRGEMRASRLLVRRKAKIHEMTTHCYAYALTSDFPTAASKKFKGFDMLTEFPPGFVASIGDATGVLLHLQSFCDDPDSNDMFGEETADTLVALLNEGYTHLWLEY